jgi:hypothetical protein
MPKLSMPEATESTEVATPRRGRPPNPAPLALAGNGSPFSMSEVEGMSGDTETPNLQPPKLALINPGSDIGKKFGEKVHGAWCYDSEVFLGDDIKVIIVNADKRWTPNLPWERGVVLPKYDNLAAARADGHSRAEVVALAIIDVLVCIPIDDENANIGRVSDEKYAYAPARWWATSFGNMKAYDELDAAMRRSGDRAVFARFYDLKSLLKPTKGNSNWRGSFVATDEILTVGEVDIARSMGAGSAPSE